MQNSSLRQKPCWSAAVLSASAADLMMGKLAELLGRTSGFSRIPPVEGLAWRLLEALISLPCRHSTFLELNIWRQSLPSCNPYSIIYQDLLDFLQNFSHTHPS